MKSKKKDGVSIADLVTLSGVLVSTVTAGLGMYYITFDLLTAVLCALGLAALEGCLVWLIVKFKQKDSSFRNWRIAEISLLVVMGVVLAATVIPVSAFLGVSGHKGEIQQSAHREIKQIRDGISNFQQQEREALTVTCSGLKNMLSSHASRTVGLINFVSKYGITSEQRLTDYKSQQEQLINDMSIKSGTGVGTEMYKPTWDRELEEIERIVENWNFLMIPSAVTRLEEVNEQVEAVSTIMNRELIYPVIKREHNTYHIVEMRQDVRQYTGEVNFRAAFNGIAKCSLPGVGLTVLTGFFVLFKYLVCPRSRRVGISRNKSGDFGRLL
ncbi:MAG: hypothetical protein K2N03_02370 [Muribaculaceae bacterium]|nr:hypothetical protein [Muribaculaceae bacterium]